MIEQDQQARRGRPPRATDDRRQRRQQEGDLEEFELKLPIPDWVLEKYPSAEYQHRWFRDEPGRLSIMHKRDWDAVEGVDPVPGAQDKFGKPINHILMVKYLDWYQADKAKLDDRRKEVVRQMERGNVKGAGDDAGETLRSEVSYVDASNRLG